MGRATDQIPRRRPRLSLRGMILLVLVLGLWLGWHARRTRLQREAVAAVRGYGGFVRYDWEFVNGRPATGAVPRAPGWLRRAIGDAYFQDVVEVDMVHATDRRGMPDLTPGESDALVARLAAFPHLRHLDLPGELAADRAMETIRALTELETLRMWDARISTAGLARARALRKLRVLQLSDAGLGDDALEHLAPLLRLEQLELGGNPITDAGMKHIGRLKALQLLTINRTRVTDAGLEELHGLTNLKEIWVSGSAVSDEAVMRFRAAMPNLTTVR